MDPISRDLLVRTVIGEAGNQDDLGKAAVAHVVMNRANTGRYGGNTVQDVVLAPNQFEPWQTRSQELLSYTADSPAYQEAARVVDAVAGGQIPDPTQGATHFLNADIVRQRRGGSLPAWAQGEGQQIGAHTFYAPEGRAQMASMIEVEAPDGTVVEFPEGTPRETILDVMRKNFGQAAQEPMQDARQDLATAMQDRSGMEAQGQMAQTIQQSVMPSEQPEGPSMATGVARELVGQGMGFGFGDEIEAGVRTGFGMAGDYGQTLEGIRGEIDQFRETNPGIAMGSEIAGALATGMLPVGMAARGASMLGRVRAGAGAGAGYGALYGAGTGEGAEDRVSGAVSGGIVGGVAGGVTPMAVAGVQAAGRGARGLYDRAVGQTARGALNAEGEAARRVAGALERDAGQGLSQPEMLAARQGGQPVNVMDMGGETTRALARSAANTVPEGREVLNRAVNARFEGQGERAVEMVRNLVTTPANASKTREALEESARQSRRPFYEKAYRDGRNGVWNDDLAAIWETPAVQAAVRDAETAIANKAGTGRAIPVPQDGSPPSLEFWDQVKRSLDSRASVLRRSGDREAAADITSITRTLVDNLDSAVPSYGVARGVAKSFFDADSALEAGEKFVTLNKPVGETRRAIAQMTPEERDLFREGFASSLIERINGVRDRSNVINSIYSSPKAREKIEVALGPERAKQFEAFVRAENIMDMARSAVQGNSTTARQLMELGLAGGAHGAAGLYSFQSGDPRAIMVTGLLHGARRAQVKIDERVARRVAEMLVSDDPAVIERGVKMVAKQGKLLDALRALDRPAAAASAQQATQRSPLEITVTPGDR